jgi:repressor of nif and glnA expression
MKVEWDTLVADEKGVIDYNRIRNLVSILLAVAGGCVIVMAAVVELTKLVDVHTDALLIAAGVLVAPITGGAVAGAIAKQRASNGGA